MDMLRNLVPLFVSSPLESDGGGDDPVRFTLRLGGPNLPRRPRAAGAALPPIFANEQGAQNVLYIELPPRSQRVGREGEA